LVALRSLEERFRVEEKGDVSIEQEEPTQVPKSTPERPASTDIDTDDPDAENLWLLDPESLLERS
jgi:hypothetical protein